MAKAKLKTIEQTDTVSLYSICLNEEQESEFEKFILKFKDNGEVNEDYKKILFALSKIVSNGVFERHFRIEGKMNDSVCALSINSKKLRLYCLRISDQILIVGNGGVKKTRTYQEDEELLGYVISLQKFESLLKQAQKNGEITIEKNIITHIEEKIFTL